MGHPYLGVLSLTLRHLVHQMRRHVVHRLHGGDQVFEQRRQALEQGHNNVLVFHGYL